MKNLLCLLACGLLAGCTSLPYSPPRLLEPDARFPGLVDFAAGVAGGPADVLLVHGMCTHDVGWVDQTMAQLGAALGAIASPAPSADGTGVEIVTRSIRLPDGELRIHALLWSGLTAPFKRQLDYDHTARLGATRARINGELKDTLMDDCLPDALAYQGVAGAAIRLRMREAILQATSQAQPGAPLVVLAESLGSKILFDTLLQMSEEGGPGAVAAQRTIERMAYLVMAANQLPLLAIADQQLPGAGAPGMAAHGAAGTMDSLQAVLRKRRPDATPSPRAPAARLVLVAFSDPNDLLTYTLQRERYAGPGVEVYNVLVSNAPTWFGLLEHPGKAHRDYLLNPAVARLVACGTPRSSRCE